MMSDKQWMKRFPNGYTELMWRITDKHYGLYIRWTAHNSTARDQWGEYSLKTRPRDCGNSTLVTHLEYYFNDPLSPTEYEILMFKIEHNRKYPIKPI